MHRKYTIYYGILFIGLALCLSTIFLYTPIAGKKENAFVLMPHYKSVFFSNYDDNKGIENFVISANNNWQYEDKTPIIFVSSSSDETKDESIEEKAYKDENIPYILTYDFRGEVDGQSIFDASIIQPNRMNDLSKKYIEKNEIVIPAPKDIAIKLLMDHVKRQDGSVFTHGMSYYFRSPLSKPLAKDFALFYGDRKEEPLGSINLDETTNNSQEEYKWAWNKNPLDGPLSQNDIFSDMIPAGECYRGVDIDGNSFSFQPDYIKAPIGKDERRIVIEKMEIFNLEDLLGSKTTIKMKVHGFDYDGKNIDTTLYTPGECYISVQKIMSSASISLDGQKYKKQDRIKEDKLEMEKSNAYKALEEYAQ